MFDLIDRKIIFELQWNARQTYSKLAKRLKISKQVARYRIEQLEKKEIIKSYHALIDWRALGYNALRIYLRWQNISPEKEQEIYKYIKKDPLFMWSVKFEGDVDIAFYVWIKSIPEFSEKWFLFLEKYGEHILEQEIYESISMINYRLKPLIEEKNTEEVIIGLGKETKTDAIDMNILSQVTKNARISAIDISKELGITAKAIVYRLKQLEKKKIILGYNALIDTNKLKYSTYKVDFYLSNRKRIIEFEELAKMHKSIIYRMKTIGGPDIEIELLVQNVNEMKIIIDTFRSRFSDCIQKYRINRLEYTLKQIYLPGENIT